MKPVLSITPPPRDLEHTQSTVTTLSEEGNKEATPAAVSPSEVDTNFFRRSVTPTLSEQDRPQSNSQSEKPVECRKAEQASSPPNGKTPTGRSSRMVDTPTSVSKKNSPRMSLSLKKSGAPYCTARRSLELPGVGAKTASGFEMGVAPQAEQDSMLSYGSTPSPPPITVPSDSQFEASDSTEVFFKLSKPSLNQSRASEAEEVDEEKVPAVTSEEPSPNPNPSQRSKGEETDVVPATKTFRESLTPELSSGQEEKSERPSKKSLVESPANQPASDDGEEMEVEHVPGTASRETQASPVPERQRHMSDERSKLSIPWTTSSDVASSSTAPPPKCFSPIPSLQLQPSLSPMRQSASPMLNPLHPRVPPGYHHPHSPLSSLASSEFVSPGRSISAEGLQELRRQVVEQLGREVEVSELRYVRTVCTVIEERVISSELVENGVVVSGSGKCWPVSVSLKITNTGICLDL